MTLFVSACTVFINLVILACMAFIYEALLAAGGGLSCGSDVLRKISKTQYDPFNTARQIEKFPTPITSIAFRVQFTSQSLVGEYRAFY